MFTSQIKSSLTVALALAAAMTLVGCNKKTDDTVRPAGPSSTSPASSGSSGPMAPSSGASGVRP